MKGWRRREEEEKGNGDNKNKKNEQSSKGFKKGNKSSDSLLPAQKSFKINPPEAFHVSTELKRNK